MLQKTNASRQVTTRVPSISMNPVGMRAQGQLASNNAARMDNLNDWAYQVGLEERTKEAEENAHQMTFQRAAQEHAIEYEVNGEVKQRVMRDEFGLVLPELPDKDGFSIYDNVYRSTVLARYAQESEMGMRKTLAELASTHEHDPMAFANAADAYRTSYLEAMPQEVQQVLGKQMRNITMQQFNTLQ